MFVDPFNNRSANLYITIISHINPVRDRGRFSVSKTTPPASDIDQQFTQSSDNHQYNETSDIYTAFVIND